MPGSPFPCKAVENLALDRKSLNVIIILTLIFIHCENKKIL